MSVFQDQMPVIVGVGEVLDRPDATIEREPARLMADALRAAEKDAGACLLPRLSLLDVVQEISWPYTNAAARVAAELGIAPRFLMNGAIGGETPTQSIHQAALRIQAGEIEIAGICGGEAEYSVRRATKEKRALPWSPRDENAVGLRGSHVQRRITRRLEATLPAHVYPFYENATRAVWGLTLEEAQHESATLWWKMSRTAATRDCAWKRQPIEALEIGTISPANRPIAWPYPKLMTANPMVNQGAAVILTSYRLARSLSIPAERLVFVWGGKAGHEPNDVLERRSYAHAPGMVRALEGATSLAGRPFDFVELYSCFPCVPKMARRVLGLPADASTSVTGGLTFFGAPLNNYMTHATVATVQRLRDAIKTSIGLLYGQGGYVTKHHTLVLSRTPPFQRLAEDALEPGEAVVFTGVVDEAYAGPADLETYTVLFDRDGKPRHGVVVAQGPRGVRAICRAAADDTETIEALLDPSIEAVGRRGIIEADVDGISRWRFQ
jgi:acetyl-CoA C-acetyltransferase